MTSTRLKFLNQKLNDFADRVEILEGLQVNMALQANVSKSLEERQNSLEESL